MKITQQGKTEYVTHHEVGQVYKDGRDKRPYILARIRENEYRFICLENGESTPAWESLKSIDRDNTDDILVDAELVIKE